MNITKLAILTLFSYLPLSAMEFSEQALINPNAQCIRNEAIIACNNLGKIKVYHDDGTFKIKHNKTILTVASHDVDPFLRKLNSDQLHAFLEKGALKVKQLNNGDFTVGAYNRGLGGGPIAGLIVPWLIRATMYGAPAAVAVVAAPAVATVMVPVSGVGTVCAAGGLSAATSTVGVSAAAGSYMATTEGFATGMGIVATLCPWLP